VLSDDDDDDYDYDYYDYYYYLKHSFTKSQIAGMNTNPDSVVIIISDQTI